MKALWKIIVAFGLLSVPIAGYAQVPPAASSPPSSQTLATSLATAKIPSHRIYLSVSAETVTLPQDTPMLPNGSTLTTITDTFQCSVRAFGAVTAIAPPTMFVLNRHPTNPDLYADVQPEEIFKLLAASLSDTQWKALTSQDGLAVSALASDDQRQWFQALFPGGTFKVGLVNRNADTPNGELDLSNELSQVRLRLDQRVIIGLPMKGGGNGFSSDGGSSTDQSRYRWEPQSHPSNSLYGVQQSAEIPNALKPGQLDWNLPVLGTPILLTGLKTVADLIERTGQMTHLELYADKRYEAKSLTLLGADNTSVPASDLLRSLAFCLSGAFRQVGPAFVLTDDVIGTEARKGILKQFALDAEQRINAHKDKAADILGTTRSFSGLSAGDNPLALNAAEQKSAVSDFSGESVILPLDQLTSAQQESARQEAAKMTEENQSLPDDSKPDLSRDLQLDVSPHLEFIVPSLKTSVTTDFGFTSLFFVSAKLQKERAVQEEQNQPEASPPLAQMMVQTPRRALLMKLTSSADLTAEIGAMKRLGFNELWLPVFSEGHLQTALPDGKDLLAQALHMTRGSNIQVYAVVDLFQWGTDAPPGAVDIDALGETSAQAEARLQSEAAIEADAMGNPAPLFQPISGLFVTPFDPSVSNRLIAVIKSLAKRPGLAGIVLRQTAPSGYDEERETVYSAHQPDLGYTEPARLAFLRQEHTDPIDVSKTRIQNEGQRISGSMGSLQFSLNGSTYADPSTSIPGFNNPAQDAQLSIAWDKFRMDADVSVMRHLYSVIRVSNPSLPVFVQQRHRDFSQDWYGSWDSPTAPIPEWKIIFTDGRMEHREDQIAKKQSHLALIGLDADDADDISGLASALSENMKDTTWNGFVWDITPLKSDPLH